MWSGDPVAVTSELRRHFEADVYLGRFRPGGRFTAGNFCFHFRYIFNSEIIGAIARNLIFATIVIALTAVNF